MKTNKIFTAILVVVLNLTVAFQSPAQTATFIHAVGKQISIQENVNVSAKAVSLTSAINSAGEELKPAVTPDGSRIYFSRPFHPNNTVGEMDQEDIWYTELNRETSTWSEPVRLTGVLNNDGPNYVNNVSKTGDTLIVGNQYLKKGKMRAGLSYSVNVNGQWTFPTAINIKNDYNMSEHSNSFVSLKNGVIIRSIQRAETFGERDLYVSFWNGVEATEPINMGNVINTEYEESSPFMAADNKTLYFASKGHNGFGGYDIYVTERLDESWTNWTKPRNLGPAVNGPMDEEFFTITHCGKYAYFSKQISVHNSDIFRLAIAELYASKPSAKSDIVAMANK
jgi:hypothetical protein